MPIKIPRNIIEASFDLGCKPFQAFRYVIFPIGFPGLIVGSIFVFMARHCACHAKHVCIYNYDDYHYYIHNVYIM